MYEIFVIRPPEGPSLYAVSRKDTGRSFVRSDRTELVGLMADGTRVTMTPNARAGWYSAVHGVVAVEMTTQQYDTVTGYVLRDPAAESVRFPANLTREEHDRREEGGEEDVLAELYTRRTEPTPALVHRVEGPFPTLEGREPPGPDEPAWIASLPEMLNGRPEYAHLYPGHIPGLRDHVMKLIKMIPGVTFASTTYDNYAGVSVTVQVPYSPNVTRWRANVGSRGQTLRTGREVTEYHSRHLRLPVPSRVAGENYADALTQWDEAVEFWTNLVREAGVKACGHCKGTGVVEDGAVSFEKGI